MRAPARAVGLVLAVLVAAAASATVAPAAVPAGLAALVGAGLVDRLLCMSCAAALVLLATEATPWAILVMMSENPEAASTCLALCYIVAQG